MPYVYYYKDKNDETVKYVGLIREDTNFPLRFAQHKKDSWYMEGSWSIWYLPVETRTDAEALEAHYISYFGTWKYYNNQKSGWGECTFAPDSIEWLEFDATKTEPVIDIIRELEIVEANVRRLKDALSRYESKDIVDLFIDNKIIHDPLAMTKAKRIFGAFDNFRLQSKRLDQMGNITFYKMMENKGYKRIHTRDGDFFIGIALMEAET